MPKLKLTRVYPGYYRSLNANPAAAIERGSDGWSVSWSGHSERWRSLAECRSLIESAASMGDRHCYPISLNSTLSHSDADGKPHEHD